METDYRCLGDDCPRVAAEHERSEAAHYAVGECKMVASILLEFVRRATGRPTLTYTDAASLDLAEANAIQRDHEAIAEADRRFGHFAAVDLPGDEGSPLRALVELARIVHDAAKGNHP